ncbi:MAG: T9SS type A sorting domain-containing protein [Chitinophagales bacterium]|nr:T9SS type A sorting domain-containing protein [Chitinophagales bacterium]
MKYLFTLIAALGFCFNYAYAQTECDNGRYINREYFDSVTVTSGINFGSNSAVQGGGTEQLDMDIYQPYGDTLAERPVILFAFGGSFIGGSRTDSYIRDLCTDFAKMGYVTVAFDYRVGLFVPNEVNTTLAVVRAMHDMKAAVRYLRRSVVELGNPYGIDTSFIVAGGVSAGAITALQTGYFDKESEIPTYLDTTLVDSLGGVEGNSGNAGYSSRVHAVIGYSGAIGDTLWIEAGDIPMITIHEINDNVVPFDTREVAVSGIPTGLIASGSGSIKGWCDQIGVLDRLYTYNSSNHTGYIASDYDTTVARTARFLKDDAGVCTASVGIKDIKTAGFNVYPNPVESELTIQVNNNEPYTVQLFSTIGQVAYSQSALVGNAQLDFGQLAPGIYVLKLANQQGSTLQTQKVIVR